MYVCGNLTVSITLRVLYSRGTKYSFIVIYLFNYIIILYLRSRIIKLWVRFLNLKARLYNKAFFKFYNCYKLYLYLVIIINNINIYIYKITKIVLTQTYCLRWTWKLTNRPSRFSLNVCFGWCALNRIVNITLTPSMID